MCTDGMEMRNYRMYKKYIQGNLTKGSIVALVFILVCILCYLLTTVHHLKSRMRDNEALLISTQAQTQNSDELSPKVQKLDNELQEMKTKLESIKQKFDNLERSIETTLINYEEHINVTGPGIHIDSVLNSSFLRRMNDFNSDLQEVQTLTQQNSELLLNVTTNNNSKHKHKRKNRMNTEISKMEDDIEKLKHLVTGENFSGTLILL